MKGSQMFICTFRKGNHSGHIVPVTTGALCPLPLTTGAKEGAHMVSGAAL